jgi:hypothetical protein
VKAPTCGSSRLITRVHARPSPFRCRAGSTRQKPWTGSSVSSHERPRRASRAGIAATAQLAGTTTPSPPGYKASRCHSLSIPLLPFPQSLASHPCAIGPRTGITRTPPCLPIHLPLPEVVGGIGGLHRRERSHPWCLRAESATALPLIVCRRGRNTGKPPGLVVSSLARPILGKFTSPVFAVANLSCSRD